MEYNDREVKRFYLIYNTYINNPKTLFYKDKEYLSQGEEFFKNLYFSLKLNKLRNSKIALMVFEYANNFSIEFAINVIKYIYDSLNPYDTLDSDKTVLTDIDIRKINNYQYFYHIEKLLVFIEYYLFIEKIKNHKPIKEFNLPNIVEDNKEFLHNFMIDSDKKLK